MMYLKGKNAHFRDERITFLKKDHQYLVRDEKNKETTFLSVSTFISSFFPKFDEKAVLKNLKTVDKESKYFQKSDEAILEIWKETAVLGTNLHETIELFYNAFAQPSFIEHKLPNQPEMEQFLKFHHDFTEAKYLEPYRTEWPIFIERYEIAGTIDILFKIRNTDFYVLMDWKRIEKLHSRFGNANTPIQHVSNSKFHKYSLNLTLYRYIVESQYGLKILKNFLVIFHPNQVSYEVVETPYLEAELQKLLEIRELCLDLPLE